MLRKMLSKEAERVASKRGNFKISFRDVTLCHTFCLNFINKIIKLSLFLQKKLVVSPTLQGVTNSIH